MIAPRFTVAALRSLVARWRGDTAAPLVLTCYGKPDCSLCDKAKGPVRRLVASSGGRGGGAGGGTPPPPPRDYKRGGASGSR